MEILLAHIFVAYEGWKLDTRTLKQYQLQFTLDGSALFRIEKSTFEAKKRDMIVIRPGEAHSAQRACGEPYTCVSITFDFDPLSISLEQLLGGRHHFPNLDLSIVKDVQRLVALHRQPGLVSRVECLSVLMKIVADLAKRRRDEDGDPPAEPRTNAARINLVKNYMIAHYHQEIRHDDLEERFGFSRNHLINQFRKTVGMTPMQYVTLLRLQKVMELAVHTELSFSEIADRVGYPDVHTLGKMFKKKMGCSLSEYCSTIFIERLKHS